jgi:hypothetical protein
MQETEEKVLEVGNEPQKATGQKGGKEDFEDMGFEQAQEELDLLSRYFKPETNIEYHLTFRPEVRIGKKPIPDFNDPKILVKKVVLRVWVDSRGGKECNQKWDILSPKLMDQVRVYAENKTLSQHVFTFKQRGEGKKRDYIFAVMGSRKNPPAKEVALEGYLD